MILWGPVGGEAEVGLQVGDLDCDHRLVYECHRNREDHRP
jgi:hypothetical protein